MSVAFSALDLQTAILPSSSLLAVMWSSRRFFFASSCAAPDSCGVDVPEEAEG